MVMSKPAMSELMSAKKIEIVFITAPPVWNLYPTYSVHPVKDSMDTLNFYKSLSAEVNRGDVSQLEVKM